MTSDLPAALELEIETAGYYPQLVRDVLTTALGGQHVNEHLVHLETTFEGEEFHRHVTVLALTDSTLVLVHADDHVLHHGITPHPHATVTATSETIALGFIRGVTLTHVFSDAEHYRNGALGREVTLTLGWGTMSRVDLLPATCGDPACDADHGFEGTVTGDDISLRISADAEGEGRLNQAMAFAKALSAAIGTSRR